MQNTKQPKTWRLSRKNQIVILSIVLVGLVIIALYDFMNFLAGIRVGNLVSLALLVSIMGSGFALMHELGFGLTYKEEIELDDNSQDSRKIPNNP